MTNYIDALVSGIASLGVIVTNTIYEEDSAQPLGLHPRPHTYSMKNVPLDVIANPPPPLQFLDEKSPLPIDKNLLVEMQCNELLTYGLFPRTSGKIGVVLYAFIGINQGPHVPDYAHSQRMMDDEQPRAYFTSKSGHVSPLPEHHSLILDERSYDNVVQFCQADPLQINVLFEKITGTLLWPEYNGRIVGMPWSELNARERREDFRVSFKSTPGETKKLSRLLGLSQ